VSNLPAQWSPRHASTTPQQGASLLTLLPTAVELSRRHPLVLSSIFALIALAALAIGVVMPKNYTSKTSILVEQSNIIGPLMEGRAVPTDVANRAMIARDVAFSRMAMNDILQAGGWLASHPSAVAQDRLIEKIKNRTSISSPRGNLIQISYSDPSPQRALAVTQKFAEIVIRESLATKERESRDAFNFINSQVAQYHAKLTQAEGELERYRRANPDARAGVVADVNLRIAELRRLVDSARMDMIDTRSQQGALQSQLSGESEISAVRTRAGQIRARLAELNSERERLLLTYTEQYPDVVRTNHQIRDLEDELRREDTRGEARLASNPGAMDGSAAMNPLYSELRRRLADARQRNAASASRASTAQALLNQELARSGRIARSESKLAELTRDYEVNRDLYQDLLKRRENARVSMNLDIKREGLTFRIQDPATLPVRPTGLRLMHVAGIGLFLAVLAPVMLVFGYAKLDPRVRSPLEIERKAGLPVLGVVPAFRRPEQRRHSARQLAFASLLVLSVPAIFGITMLYRMAN
jgi:polysaccharide chain length determinant protein (PEP-CTERM system associated)